MSLLTDKDTEKDLNNRLLEFIQFGMVLNYMMDLEKIDIDDLEKLFFDVDQEKVTFIYCKLLKEINPEYIDKAYTIYSHDYPNEQSLDKEEYDDYLNNKCVCNIIDKISKKSKRLDKTYVNTYNYLLKNKYVDKLVRK